MSEGVAIVLISVFGTGILTAFITWLTRLSGRLQRLERRDKLSWLYIRSLIVSHNTHAPGVPLPEPPDGWLDEIE
jgi:hypothetical protein